MAAFIAGFLRCPSRGHVASDDRHGFSLETGGAGRVSGRPMTQQKGSSERVKPSAGRSTARGCFRVGHGALARLPGAGCGGNGGAKQRADELQTARWVFLCLFFTRWEDEDGLTASATMCSVFCNAGLIKNMIRSLWTVIKLMATIDRHFMSLNDSMSC